MRSAPDLAIPKQLGYYFENINIYVKTTLTTFSENWATI